MSDKPAIAVIGAGIMGLSTAWALYRAGAQVSVFEQAHIPNPEGSSVDESRLIRHPYGNAMGYTAMVDPSFAAWDRLFADLTKFAGDEPLYHETGTLVMDTGGAEGRDAATDRSWNPERKDWIAGSRRCLEQLSVAHRDLDGAGCAALVPGLRGEIVLDAFHVATGGVLHAGRIVELTAHYLSRSGVHIHPNRPVHGLDLETGILDFGDGTTEQFDAVVVAAGAWVTKLLPELGARVTPSRQMVVYINLTNDELAAWRMAPMLLDIDPANGFYAVPPVFGNRLKIGDHKFSLSGDPDDDRDVARDAALNVVDWAAARLGNLDRSRLESARACFYTVQPEERFLLEPMGRKGFVMSGFSGHGFKFGALMGEAMADMVLGQRDKDVVTPWAAGLASVA